MLSILSLVLVEVPALWQREGALEAVTYQHLSFQNLHVQLVELVDEGWFWSFFWVINHIFWCVAEIVLSQCFPFVILQC
jgi:hypothetical protein